MTHTPLSRDLARALEGSGWDGDLDEMRISRMTRVDDNDIDVLARHTPLTLAAAES